MKTGPEQNKAQPVISFRPRMESEAAEAFFKAIDDLGVEKSELAVRAFERGLKTAIDEIRKAIAWLRRCRLKEHRPIGSNSDHWKKLLKHNCGIDWTPDLLRHTAASYLLAKHQDAGKVARMLGNSPAILLTHYYELVRPEDLRRFWACPSSERRATDYQPLKSLGAENRRGTDRIPPARSPVGCQSAGP